MANMNSIQRAAAAYRIALATKETASSIAPEFPRAAAKLEEAAKLLVSEGKRAEAEK